MYVFGNISSAWIEIKLPCYWFENISVYVYGMNQAVFCLLIATFEIANRKATKAQYTSDLATTDAPTDGMSDMEPDPEKRTSKRRVIYSSDSSPKKNAQSDQTARSTILSVQCCHHWRTCQQSLLPCWT